MIVPRSMGSVADRLLAVLEQELDLAGHLGARRALGQPAVAALGRTPQRRLRRAADPDRQRVPGAAAAPCPPSWMWPQYGVSMSGYSFANASRITSIAASVTFDRARVVEPQEVELTLEVAGADTEDRSPAGQLVEGHERLRGVQRVPVAHDVDVRHDPHVRRERGDPAQRRDGVVPGRLHVRVERLRHREVVAHRDVEEPGRVGLSARSAAARRRRRRLPSPRRTSSTSPGPAAASRTRACPSGNDRSRPSARGLGHVVRGPRCDARSSRRCPGAGSNASTACACRLGAVEDGVHVEEAVEHPGRPVQAGRHAGGLELRAYSSPSSRSGSISAVTTQAGGRPASDDGQHRGARMGRRRRPRWRRYWSRYQSIARSSGSSPTPFSVFDGYSLRVAAAVDHGVDEQLERQRGPTAVARHQRDDGGEVAARAVARDRRGGSGSMPELRGVLGDPRASRRTQSSAAAGYLCSGASR